MKLLQVVKRLLRFQDNTLDIDEFMEVAAQIHNGHAIEAEERGNYLVASIFWRKALSCSVSESAREFYLKRLIKSYEKTLEGYQNQIEELQECRQRIH